MLRSYLIPFFLIPCLFISCTKKKIDFNTEVRPILNKHCVSCHGGIKQSGGFGLVFRENALALAQSGKAGIIPFSSSKSEMINRITHSDPALRMPYERESLSSDDIQILTDWIDQGAEWQTHWAYIPPELPVVPTSNGDWGINEIDYFTYKKMVENELNPNSKANPYDLVRRLSLDVVGLPPSWEQAENFAQKANEDHYINFVDSLLESPSFGEHWASMWLDLARYADSRGYEKDSHREIWKYRDWVIDAFNQDMPFDEFTIQQLAGDLLPYQKPDQLIATAFHRNTPNNDEGGTDNEENRVATVLDRVNTTWETWQSTTMSCVQCHSHPYDPIKQNEYYESMAFFNNTLDGDLPTEQPLLKELNNEDQKKLENVKNYLSESVSENEVNKFEKLILTGEPKVRAEDFTKMLNLEFFNRGDQDFAKVRNESLIAFNPICVTEKLYLSYRTWSSKSGQVSISLDGKVIASAPLYKTTGFELLPIKLNVPISPDDNLELKFSSSSKDFYAQINGILALPIYEIDEGVDFTKTIDHLITSSGLYTTPITLEKDQKISRITTTFDRGNWLVPTDTVSPGVPEIFNSDEVVSDRLDFAKWLVSEENPLTARVFVNRVWAKIFGQGLVKTVEDFGALGDRPTHPELLDWLAIKFSTEWQWSTKKLIRFIVLSETYSQSAITTDSTLQLDPSNTWLSRSYRNRLSAEQLRDQTLKVSGLLSQKMKGPSVMPFQPDGVWSVVYSNLSWKTSEGEDAHRRAIYTYLRRSTLYPSFVAFDAADRQLCTSRRINTNTPVQALVSLNDEVNLESARYLINGLYAPDLEIDETIKVIYQRMILKPMSNERGIILRELFNQSLKIYQNENSLDNNPTKSALIVVVNAIQNLDEFLTKN